MTDANAGSTFFPRTEADARVPSFVFRPGGTASAGVYITWATLVAAVAACVGERTVVVDCSVAPVGMFGLKAAIVPVGAWDLSPLGLGAVTLQGNTQDPSAPTMLQTDADAVSIAGVREIRGLLVVNQSSLPLFSIASGGIAEQLTLSGTTLIAHSTNAVGRSIRSTGGVLRIKDEASITSYDGGTGALENLSGTLLVRMQDRASITIGQAVSTAGTLTVLMSPNATYAAQSAAASVVPSGAVSKGTTTLSSGVSPSLTCVGLATTSTIVAFYRTPSGSTLTTKLAALNADRSVGAQGTFKISALIAAETVNTADGSTVDWIAYA